MKANRVLALTAAAGLLGVLTFSAATSLGQTGQPEAPRQPGPGGGQPGGGRPGGRGEAPSVDASMKGMNRAIQQLRDQVADPSKKDACLKLINDAQRGCIGAKGGVPHQITDMKDEGARAKAADSFRRHLLTLARKLLDIEQNILDGKTDAAKAMIGEVVKMRDDGHKEFGVDDH